jgi:hypothetical protein
MSPAAADRLLRGDGAAGAVVSRSALMTLRRVLHAYREGWLLEGRLAAAARMVAEDARQHGLGAAPTLVALERAWAGLAEVRGLPAGEARALCDRLVTLGIRAYYAHGGTRSQTPGAGAGATCVAGEGGRQGAGSARHEPAQVSVAGTAA